MSASAIHRALGENTPVFGDFIKRLQDDDRFERDVKKCWSVAKEESHDGGPPKKARTGTKSMVNRRRTTSACRNGGGKEGAAKKPYRDD